jgi:hypothetical protein
MQHFNKFESSAIRNEMESNLLKHSVAFASFLNGIKSFALRMELIE